MSLQVAELTTKHAAAAAAHRRESHAAAMELEATRCLLAQAQAQCESLQQANAALEAEVATLGTSHNAVNATLMKLKAAMSTQVQAAHGLSHPLMSDRKMSTSGSVGTALTAARTTRSPVAGWRTLYTSKSSASKSSTSALCAPRSAAAATSSPMSAAVAALISDAQLANMANECPVSPACTPSPTPAPGAAGSVAENVCSTTTTPRASAAQPQSPDVSGASGLSSLSRDDMYDSVASHETRSPISPLRLTAYDRAPPDTSDDAEMRVGPAEAALLAADETTTVSMGNASQAQLAQAQMLPVSPDVRASMNALFVDNADSTHATVVRSVASHLSVLLSLHSQLSTLQGQMLEIIRVQASEITVLNADVVARGKSSGHLC